MSRYERSAEEKNNTESTLGGLDDSSRKWRSMSDVHKNNLNIFTVWSAATTLYLVLGSTGSIGSAIVNELSSTGKPVRALVRNPAKAGKVFANPDKVEFVEGSVEDPQTLQNAFDGVEL